MNCYRPSPRGTRKPCSVGPHQLVEVEFLYQRGLPPQATYLFKHALIQDAAYQSLLRSTRQWHHQRIAQVLEARFSDICETQPELLAHHYTEAGFMAQAIPYWQRAGQRALERSAQVEAIPRHGTRGFGGATHRTGDPRGPPPAGARPAGAPGRRMGANQRLVLRPEVEQDLWLVHRRALTPPTYARPRNCSQHCPDPPVGCSLSLRGRIA